MSEKAPGLEKYTPTRLEWLAIQLNATVPVRLEHTNLGPLFLPGRDGKTLLMLVNSESNLDQERLDSLMNNIESLVTSFVENYEWDSWLKFEVRFIDKENDK